MNIYIASSLLNIEPVQQLRDYLQARGYKITYDWTAHGQVQGSQEELEKIAVKEINIGVSDADVVVVLLPGRRGTHAEIGAAVAFGKKVIICADTEDAFDTTSTNATMVYHHPFVVARLVKPSHEKILAYLQTIESTMFAKA